MSKDDSCRARRSGSPSLVIVLCLSGLLACQANKLGGSDDGAGGAAATSGGSGGDGAGTGAGGLGGFGAAGGSGGKVYTCGLPRGRGGDGSAGAAGTGGGGSGGAMDFCPTSDTPPTDPAALRVYQLVEAEQHAKLQRVVGQYACGTSPLYRGTFAASDGFEAIESGPVIASLETTSSYYNYVTCYQTVTGVRALMVISTAQSKAIRLFQIPGGDASTYSSPVTALQSGWTPPARALPA